MYTAWMSKIPKLWNDLGSECIASICTTPESMWSKSHHPRYKDRDKQAHCAQLGLCVHNKGKDRERKKDEVIHCVVLIFEAKAQGEILLPKIFFGSGGRERLVWQGIARLASVDCFENCFLTVTFSVLVWLKKLFLSI